MAVWVTAGLLATAHLALAVDYTVFERWNAVPSGDHTPCSSLDECQDACANATRCLQFSYNEEFKVHGRLHSKRLNTCSVRSASRATQPSWVGYLTTILSAAADLPLCYTAQPPHPHPHQPQQLATSHGLLRGLLTQSCRRVASPSWTAARLPTLRYG